MNNPQVTILVVDDDEMVREAHSIMLEDSGYVVLQAENGEEAEKILNENADTIRAVLLDVIMPKVNGYELCEKIRQDDRFQQLPVLFVTTQDTLEEKMKGYEAGGNDYVIKPLIADELSYKMENVLKVCLESNELEEKLQHSTQAAMQAMSYSADLGQILEFYKDSMSAPDFETIASRLFEVTNAYGLKCSLQVYAPSETMTFSHIGQASPLEVNIMELARGKDRFLDFGTRTIINYKNFSLLTKNMPVDDQERYGSLKDSLGNLCNAIEARVAIILGDNAQERKQKVLATIRNALEETGADFSKAQKENIRAIEEMMAEVEEAFLTLGLSEQQEQNILSIAKNCLEISNKNYSKGVAANDRFEEIHNNLNTILG